MDTSRSFRRRVVTSLAVVVAVAAVVVVGTPSAASAAEQHCSMTVIGQTARGQLITTPITCGEGGEGGGFSILSVIAVHYTSANFTGSTLSIQGGPCNGGWLNMPAGWENVVSSTWSACDTTHYDGYGLSGASETLGVGGGNLGSLNDRTNSVRYT
jgi:hypothetical protein